MVSNLPAEAKNKWAEVAACHSTPEKIKLMREFISLVPKHKGTNKLLGNVRRRIAALEDELDKTKARRKGSRAGGFSVPKEGAGQIIILGPTKVGRSSLLASVTNAKVEASPIFFATRKPVIGMLPYKNIQFQLIEAPALVEGASQGKMGGSQILGLARNADGLMLMVDLSEDPVEQFRMLRSELERSGVLIGRSEGEVEVTRRSVGASVQVVGGGILVDCTLDDIRRMLESYRINSALVRVRGKVEIGRAHV
jgi:ribosome-interacting GTPase 1